MLVSGWHSPQMAICVNLISLAELETLTAGYPSLSLLQTQ